MKSQERAMIAEGEKLALNVWEGRHLTTKEIDTFLFETKIARFCCLNDDRTIHATPVWFMYKNRQSAILTPDESRKARNVKQNNSVTILVDTEEPSRGIMIYGPPNLKRISSLSLQLSHYVRNICR